MLSEFLVFCILQQIASYPQKLTLSLHCIMQADPYRYECCASAWGLQADTAVAKIRKDRKRLERLEDLRRYQRGVPGLLRLAGPFFPCRFPEHRSICGGHTS